MTPRKLAWALVLTVVLGDLVWAQEEVTVTTYYPSPRAAYNELRAKRLEDFDTVGTYFVDPSEITELKTLHVESLTIDPGDLLVQGNLTVTKATTLNDTLTVSGATTLNDTLAVSGATSLGSSLGVTGLASLSGGLTAPSGTIDTLTGTNLTYSSGKVDTLTGTSLTYTSGAIDTLTGTSLTYSSGAIDTLTGTSLSYGSGNIGTLTGTSLDYISGEFDSLKINSDLTVPRLFATDLVDVRSGAVVLASDVKTLNDIYGTNVFATNVDATNVIGNTITALDVLTANTKAYLPAGTEVAGLLRVFGTVRADELHSLGFARVEGDMGIWGGLTVKQNAVFDGGINVFNAVVADYVKSWIPGNIDALGTIAAPTGSFDNLTVKTTSFSCPPAGCVTLGAETAGDYVQSVGGGSGISVSGGTGEGVTNTISVNSSVCRSGGANCPTRTCTCSCP